MDTLNKPQVHKRVDHAPAAASTPLEWLRSPAYLFILATCAGLVGLVVWYIGAKGYNVPFQDEWLSSADVAIRTASGSLTFGDIVQQNNEHRSSITHLSTVLLTLTTGWNIKLGLFLLVPVVGLAWLFTVDLLRLHQPDMLAAGLIPLTWLLFSLRQYANWLMAFQIGWFALVVFLVAALWLLRRFAVGWGPLMGAALLCHLMLFSTLHGLPGWVIVGGVAILLGYRQPKHLIFWAVAAALSYASFLIGYNFDVIGADQGGQGAGLVTDIVNVIWYVIAYLGNPFVDSVDNYLTLYAATLISLAGLILLAFNVAFLWLTERRVQPLAVWLGLIGFSGAVALMTGLGRGHVFPDPHPVQPIISRYVTPATPLWLAFVALALMVIARVRDLPDPPSRWKRLQVANRLAFGVLIALLLIVTITSAGLPSRVTPSQAACVENYPATRNMRCLNFLYLREQPAESAVRVNDQLALHQLTIFADRPQLFSDIIYLRDLTPQRPPGRDDIVFEYYRIAPNFVAPVLDQHASGQTIFTVDLPATDDHLYFVTAAYVDRSNLDDPRFEQDGVRFRVGIQGETDADARLLTDFIFDPHIDERPTPIRLNLSEYSGQTVRLFLQTLERQTAYYDWSMWIDPIIIVRDETLSVTNR